MPLMKLWRLNTQILPWILWPLWRLGRLVPGKVCLVSKECYQPDRTFSMMVMLVGVADQNLASGSWSKFHSQIPLDECVRLYLHQASWHSLGNRKRAIISHRITRDGSCEAVVCDDLCLGTGVLEMQVDGSTAQRDICWEVRATMIINHGKPWTMIHHELSSLVMAWVCIFKGQLWGFAMDPWGASSGTSFMVVIPVGASSWLQHLMLWVEALTKRETVTVRLCTQFEGSL